MKDEGLLKTITIEETQENSTLEVWKVQAALLGFFLILPASSSLRDRSATTIRWSHWLFYGAVEKKEVAGAL